MIDDSLAQCGLIANPTREGIALRDRFNKILGAHPSLCRELALRLSGLAIRYPPADQLAASRPASGSPTSTCAMPPPPRSSACCTPRSSSCSLSGPRRPRPPATPTAWTCVTAELAGDHPDWTGVRAVLIRPDGYVAWAAHADETPPLAPWLGEAAFVRHPAAG